MEEALGTAHIHLNAQHAVSVSRGVQLAVRQSALCVAARVIDPKVLGAPDKVLDALGHHDGGRDGAVLVKLVMREGIANGVVGKQVGNARLGTQIGRVVLRGGLVRDVVDKLPVKPPLAEEGDQGLEVGAQKGDVLFARRDSLPAEKAAVFTLRMRTFL